MTQLRAFFDRIQWRLFSALSMLVAGMLLIWWFGIQTLDRLADEITRRMDELHETAEISTGLEATILNQIALGEHYLVHADPRMAEDFDRLGSQVHGLRGRYTKLATLSDQEQKQLSRVDELHSMLEVRYSVAHALHDLGRIPGAIQMVEGAQPVIGELKGLIRSLSADQAAKVTQAAVVAQEDAAQRQWFMFLLLVLTAGVGILMVLRTVAAINRPLSRLVAAANQFGGGDLNVAVDGRMPAELSVLAGAFSTMAHRLRTIVGETISTAEQISASASDLSSISEEVAASSGEVSHAMVGITSGAEEQASGLRTADTALADMRRRATDISESSDVVRKLSDQIRQLADDKRRDIGRALSTLLEVREVVKTSGEEVEQLERYSEKIDTFVETIQGIARQTNLLALNAAIEAARAGEHGRGFAVVAEEVRRLADGSARAADEVASTVRRIREQIEEVAEIMHAGTGKVAGVEEVSRGAELAFEEIVGAVEQVRAAAARVAAAAEENRLATQTVEGTVRQVGSTAESHAASAQEVSAAAEEQSAATEEMSAASVELLQAAERLKELVSGFRV
ncbi:MAG: methyl-accepting chemotaxis protein [Gemmatimonadetes bacterium]|nr:methyl-accepting chemotaxis protein [Gemmatimonadota bacterium]